MQELGSRMARQAAWWAVLLAAALLAAPDTAGRGGAAAARCNAGKTDTGCGAVYNLGCPDMKGRTCCETCAAEVDATCW